MEIGKIDWNEIQFLSWNEFRQMAPSILQLEVKRLGTLIRTLRSDTEFHNQLVRARYALQQFSACLEKSPKETVAKDCAGYLEAAIMHVSFQPQELDTKTRETCTYVLDRLRYISYRVRLIY